jgi:hypothetical protein
LFSLAAHMAPTDMSGTAVATRNAVLQFGIGPVLRKVRAMFPCGPLPED